MKYGKTKLLFDTSLKYPKQFSHVGIEIAAQMETGKRGFTTWRVAPHACVHVGNSIFILESYALFFLEVQ